MSTTSVRPYAESLIEKLDVDKVGDMSSCLLFTSPLFCDQMVQGIVSRENQADCSKFEPLVESSMTS